MGRDGRSAARGARLRPATGPSARCRPALRCARCRQGGAEVLDLEVPAHAGPGRGAGGTGGAAGSGIVIVSYDGTTQVGTGGSVSTSGGRTLHTFTSSGEFVS